MLSLLSAISPIAQRRRSFAGGTKLYWLVTEAYQSWRNGRNGKCAICRTRGDTP